MEFASLFKKKKNIKKDAPLATETTTWDSDEGQELLELIKQELTPRQAGILLQYKKHYPGGIGGYDHAMNVAETSVQKLWKNAQVAG